MPKQKAKQRVLNDSSKFREQWKDSFISCIFIFGTYYRFGTILSVLQDINSFTLHKNSMR